MDFDSREKFFKTKDETIGNFSFRVHIILRYGRAELVWVVQEGKEILLGTPWGIYSRILIDSSYRIKTPLFGTYEDLAEILKITFEMYENIFNKALADKMLKQLINLNKDCILITHGFYMHTLIKELERNGYTVDNKHIASSNLETIIATKKFN